MRPAKVVVSYATYQIADIDPEILEYFAACVLADKPIKLRAKRILGDMGKIYNKVGDGVKVPIYQDVRKLKNGKKSDRYRVPYRENGKDHFKSFTNNPKEAEDFAMAVSKRLECRDDIARGTTPIFQDEIKLGLTLLEQVRSAGLDPKITGSQLVVAQNKIQQKGVGGDIFTYFQKGIDGQQTTVPEVTITISNLLPKYLESVQANLDNDDIVVSAKKRFFAEAKRFAKEFGPLDIDTITKEQIEGWYTRRRSQKKSFNVATAIQYLSSLRNFFEFARIQKHLVQAKRGTVADLASIELTGSSKTKKALKEKNILTADEVELLIKTAFKDKKYHEYFPTLFLRIFSGMHLSEINKLRWSNFIPERQAINITPDISGYNHSPRIIPFTPDNYTLIEPFLRLARRRGEMESFINQNAVSGSNAEYEKISASYNSMARSLFRKCGIEKSQNLARHTFASHLMRATNNISYTSEMMGSHSRTVYQYYIKHDFLDRGEDLFRICRVGREPSTLSLPDCFPPGTMRTKNDLIADINSYKRKGFARGWRNKK